MIRYLALGCALVICGCPTRSTPEGPSPQPDPAVEEATEPAPQLLPSNPEPALDTAELARLRPERAEVSPDAAASFAKATNGFAFDLYGRLRKGAGDGNLAFSPASMEVALAMTWGGARGETAAQMAKVLHLPPGEVAHPAAANLLNAWNAPDRDTYELRVVNRLFGEKTYTFLPEFLGLTRTSYGAELEVVDFRGDSEGSRTHINRWVEVQTKNRIRDLLPGGSITNLTRLVLTNAVYFLGAWTKKFDEDRTMPGSFHASGSREVSVPMMDQTQSFRFAEQEGLKVLEMGYVGDELAMTILLPDARDGLAALEEQLSPETLDRWTGALRERRVKVAIPRFRIEPAASIRLKTVLAEMGMPLAFTEDADFTGMANPPDPADQLMLDDVYHKAFVEVNEEGTEAAAATAVVAKLRGRPSVEDEVPEFIADHPFIFLIRDRAGTILFIGRVVDPSSR